MRETEIRQRALGERHRFQLEEPRTGAEPLEPSQPERGGQEERTIKTLDLFCIFYFLFFFLSKEKRRGEQKGKSPSDQFGLEEKVSESRSLEGDRMDMI